MKEKSIWTIGHSTRSLEEFIALLKPFSIQELVDIRHYPGSKRYPHFNKEALEISLPQQGIGYTHLKDLGGRRKPVPGSVNTAWRNEAFRGYADYMETQSFKNAIDVLERIALKKRTAYMCSEAVWWSCHRSLVSDFLKVRGWHVWHIIAIEKATEHPFTKPAKIIDGLLRYDELHLF
jgi:uncharacterized protein (DUF488 family)